MSIPDRWVVSEGQMGSFRKSVFVLLVVAGFGLLWGCSSKEDAPPPAMGDPEGKVEKVEGDALVTRGGQGTPVHLHLGDPLFRGDVVVTEGTGSLELKLVDGTVLMVRPSTRLRINERGDGDVEAPSVMLYWGRLLSRALTAVGDDRFSVDSPTLVAGVLGTEFEMGVAEDQGTIVSVYHGKVEVDVEGERSLLPQQREIETDFMERPMPSRAFKEKLETDWVSWMAARSRNLPNRMPELVAKMERRLREIQSRREEERATAEKRLQEMQDVARTIGDAGKEGDQARRQELIRRFQELSVAHRQSMKRIQQLENRGDAAFVHAERLQKRAKGLKKELGNRYRSVSDSLRKIVEGRKDLQRGFLEDRGFLKEHRKRSAELFIAVPEAKGLSQVVREKEKPGSIPPNKSGVSKGDPRLSGRYASPPASNKPPARKDRGAGSGTKPGESKIQKAPESKKAEPAAPSKKSSTSQKSGSKKPTEKEKLKKKETGKKSDSQSKTKASESSQQ
jgi:hypothetical protein